MSDNIILDYEPLFLYPLPSPELGDIFYPLMFFAFVVWLYTRMP